MHRRRLALCRSKFKEINMSKRKKPPAETVQPAYFFEASKKEQFDTAARIQSTSSSQQIARNLEHVATTGPLAWALYDQILYDNATAEGMTEPDPDSGSCHTSRAPPVVPLVATIKLFPD
jgi:hypothetical protein